MRHFNSTPALRVPDRFKDMSRLQGCKGDASNEREDMIFQP